MPTVIPFIPQTITVHLGLPSQPAENVTVSFPDYVKNVASSEIYPTWEPAAIRANVLAIISFALNRVYTEFYPSRGYDFQITSTTAYDQKFIRGRDIFENIGEIVDEIFSDYIRRMGAVEPLAAKFCNGTTTTCDGLSQWGSQNLAQQGLDSMAILRNYYGDDIELVVNAPIETLGQSYPGSPIRLGDIGEEVFVIQVSLNRISQNYPAIPKINPVNGIYDEKTQEAVRQFQRIFGLTSDGIVGRNTWYRIVNLYTAVTKLGELVSDGQEFRKVGFQYSGVFRQGDTGGGVWALQYMLAVLAQFNAVIPQVRVDGTFGPDTEQAVRAFQSYAGLPVDGIVGEQTWDALFRSYIGIGNYLERDRVRFPNQATQAMTGQNRNDRYSTTVRLGQYPGYTMELGQSDRNGEVMV